MNKVVECLRRINLNLQKDQILEMRIKRGIVYSVSNEGRLVARF